MTQEEKLEEAKRLYKTANADQKYVLESLFPELKESEDERIRQLLLRFVEYDMPDNYSDDFSKEDCLAWLKKQGEHANFRNKIQIGDKVTRNEDGVLVNLSQLKRVAKKDEKQGEQKPTDEEMIALLRTEYEKGRADAIAEMQKSWSEEDERKIELLKSLIEDAKETLLLILQCSGKWKN